MRITSSIRVLIASSALVAAGCSESGGGGAEYPSARLEGEVTLDGKPLDGGNIQFVPKDAIAPPVNAAILQGRYAASKVGKGKVTAIISVEPPTRPEVVSSDYKPAPTIVIPDRYKGGIPIDVDADNADQNFSLTSKK